MYQARISENNGSIFALIVRVDKDGEESITITDKNSNKIFLNTKDSSIAITAPANLSLTADTIDIKAKKAGRNRVVIDAKARRRRTL